MTGDTLPSVGQTRRRRLPTRRPSVIETIVVSRGDGAVTEYSAGIGFDELGRPRELFLGGARVGSDMATLLADAAVAISVALQHGVPAEAMARSVGCIPRGDGVPPLPASAIGAALDAVARWEREE